MPLQISVVIPTYNCDRYLPQAIDSVLAQTYQGYEVIVVDDGSVDATQQVLQRYSGRYGDRIRSFRQKNQGVAVARNHGIALSQGNLIAFLDADDWFLPSKLAAQVAVFAENPTVGIVHSGWRRVDAQGIPLMDVEPWHTVPHLNLESWLRWKPVLPSAMIIQRDWLMRSGGFDPRFPPAEDTELVLRLALMGCEATWLRQITTCYRQHDDSAMHRGLPQARSLAAVIDHFFAQPNLPDRIRWLEHSVRYHTLVWIAWYLHHTGHRAEMLSFLQRAWAYTPHPLVQTFVHWADSFAEFSKSVGAEFNAHSLATSVEWQDLMQWTLSQPSSLPPSSAHATNQCDYPGL